MRLDTNLPHRKHIQYLEINNPFSTPAFHQVRVPKVRRPLGVPPATPPDEAVEKQEYFKNLGNNILEEWRRLRLNLSNPQARAAVSKAWARLSTEDRVQIILLYWPAILKYAHQDFDMRFEDWLGTGTSLEDRPDAGVRASYMLRDWHLTKLVQQNDILVLVTCRIELTPSNHAVDDFKAGESVYSQML